MVSLINIKDVKTNMKKYNIAGFILGFATVITLTTTLSTINMKVSQMFRTQTTLTTHEHANNTDPAINGKYIKTSNDTVYSINVGPFPIDKITKQQDTIHTGSYPLFDPAIDPKTTFTRVETIKVKGLGDNNFYVIDKQTNDHEIALKISKVKPTILNELVAKPEKTISVSKSTNIVKGDIISISNNEISVIEPIEEQLIDYKVDRDTYYKLDPVEVGTIIDHNGFDIDWLTVIVDIIASGILLIMFVRYLVIKSEQSEYEDLEI